MSTKNNINKVSVAELSTVDLFINTSRLKKAKNYMDDLYDLFDDELLGMIPDIEPAFQKIIEVTDIICEALETHAKEIQLRDMEAAYFDCTIVPKKKSSMLTRQPN